jgi:hypothetical protein
MDLDFIYLFLFEASTLGIQSFHGQFEYLPIPSIQSQGNLTYDTHLLMTHHVVLSCNCFL